MELKSIYKETEKEKKNRVDDSIVMSRKDFIKEHKSLIKILREGSRDELLAEAKRQEEELEDEVGEVESEDEDGDDE